MTTIIPGLYGLDSASAFRALQKDPQKYIDRFTKDPAVQKEIDYFTKKAPTFKNVDDLMKDRRALQFVLDSFGMGSEINNAGRIKKVLTEDPTASTSLVNKLVDTKFKTMATSLRLDQGMGKLSQALGLDNVSAQFIQHELEESLGTAADQIHTTADSESAYFAKASAKFRSVDDLFKDPRALKYVLDSYGISAGASARDPEKLKAMLKQDPTLATSDVNKTANKAYLQLAKDLRLDKGLDGIQSDAFVDMAKSKFIEVSVKNAFFTSLGATAGQAKIDEITKNAKKEIDYFNTASKKFTSVDSLLKDSRATQYLLDAYSVGNEAIDTPTLKKILSSDPTAKDAFVNTLTNSNYKKMATDLRLDKGMDKLTKADYLETLKTNYIQNEFEEALGQQDNALRQAAYFARNTGTINSVYAMLGDKVIRDVVTSTFNLPKELAVQSIETQAAVLAKRVDYTKFGGAGAATTISANQLTRAKSDYALLGKNLGISDAAIKQMTTLQNSLNQLITNYSNLSVVTDPGGVNAEDITVQNDAVPELVRYDQLLNAGGTAMVSVQTSVASLQTLIANAQKPGSDMASLKTQFNAVINNINAKINGAAVTTTNGTTENILLNGSADTLVTAYNADGANVSINRYDLTGMQSLLSEAQTAFNAATGSGDTTNLNTAMSRLLRGQDAGNVVVTKLANDKTALNTAVTSNAFFAASLNTDELSKGKQSVDDGLSRISKIEAVLKKIDVIATTSKGMASGADRSALETQFAAYKTELRGLIENTGTAGLDNFLNNAPDQSYEIINGKSVVVNGGFDLANLVSGIIESGSLSDPSSALDLSNKTIQVTTYTDRAKASLSTSKPIMDRVVGVYDPKGKLDNQILELQKQLDSIIDDATKSGKNLLDPEQSTIRLDGLSTGTSLSFKALSTFKQDMKTALNNIISQMGNGSNAVINALDSTADMVTRAKHSLENDNRFATMEYGKLGGTIDKLDPQNTSSANPLYQTNSFTAKFIGRYLVMNGSDGSSSNSSSNYVSMLFGNDTNSSIANIMSLAVSIKA